MSSHFFLSLDCCNAVTLLFFLFLLAKSQFQPLTKLEAVNQKILFWYLKMNFRGWEDVPLRNRYLLPKCEDLKSKPENLFKDKGRSLHPAPQYSHKLKGREGEGRPEISPSSFSGVSSTQQKILSQTQQKTETKT